jgi:hypothetical protein
VILSGGCGGGWGKIDDTIPFRRDYRMKKLMFATVLITFFSLSSFSAFADVLTPDWSIRNRLRPQASEVKVVIPDLLSEDAAFLVSDDVISEDNLSTKETEKE